MAGLISVEEATGRLLDLVAPLGTEDVPIAEAAARTLSRAIAAKHDQPPFAASVMDGYAVASDAPARAVLAVSGEAAAGAPHGGRVEEGRAVRIFTGAPIPAGTIRVIIQEDVVRDGDRIIVAEGADPGPYIRPAGADFAKGAALPVGRLSPARIALAAAMGHATLPCARRPVVAIAATGDELRPPGLPLGPGQIAASNAYGLKAMMEGAGAEVRLLPIARDDRGAIRGVVDLSKGADLLVTMGGASVGDHDLIGPVLEDMGADLAFRKVAMRPGKPLMAGRLGDRAVLGLPGNPVSSLVCGRVFGVAMVRRMLGLPEERPADVRLAAPLSANGPRAHYMRAARGPDGATAFDRQDSALLSVLAAADCLLIRPPGDAPRQPGDVLKMLPIEI